MEVDSFVEPEGSPPTPTVTNNMDDSEMTETLEETKQIENNSSKPFPNPTMRKQPDVLCSCPLLCDKKLTKEWRQMIYHQFHNLCDHAYQNQYIQRHIKIRSIAKKLWEKDDDKKVEKKSQRRVTCKYLIPMTASVKQSFHYAKTITFDTVKDSVDISCNQLNGYKLSSLNRDLKEICKTDANIVNGHDACINESPMNESTSGLPNGISSSTPKINGSLQKLPDDQLSDSMKESVADASSPSSFNDNESENTADDGNASEPEATCPPATRVKYIEVCQKAFMNMYGITEKRIRWQREKLIIKARLLAEKKRKEMEETERTLSLARSLGAGCQPLFAMLQKTNCTHLSEQLMVAIEDDVALVNNFFHNQLWKPEDIMEKSVNVSNLDLIETECD